MDARPQTSHSEDIICQSQPTPILKPAPHIDQPQIDNPKRHSIHDLIHRQAVISPLLDIFRDGPDGEGPLCRSASNVDAIELLRHVGFAISTDPQLSVTL